MQKESTMQLPKGAESISVDQYSVRKIIIGIIGRKKTAQLQKNAKGSNYILLEKPTVQKQKKNFIKNANCTNSNFEIDYFNRAQSEIVATASGKKEFLIFTLTNL